MSAWRESILKELTEERVEVRAWSFPRALELIEDAAWNRRIKPQDYIGRAAAAFAAYDSGGTITYDALMRLEPEIYDLRRRNLRMKRHFGHNFGDWEIEGLR